MRMPFATRCLAAMLFALLSAAGHRAFGEPVYKALNRMRHWQVARTRTATELLDGKFPFGFFELKGQVRDAFCDDTNPHYRWLVIKSGNETFYATVDTGECPDKAIAEKLDALVGAEISIFGIANADVELTRPYKGFILHFSSMDDITVLTKPPADPFDVPPLGDLTRMRPYRIPDLGYRRASGRVVAAWNNDLFLLESPCATNRFMRVELSDSGTPTAGDRVDVVGIPETDNFHLNLTRARWKKHPESPEETTALADSPARAIDGAELFRDEAGRERINPAFHGQLVNVRGLVRTLSADKGVLQLDDNGYLISVRLSGIDVLPSQLAVGASVAVTGICVLDVENWRIGAMFPRIKGVFLVTRSGRDVSVIAAAPWWTPRKFLSVTCILLSLLAGILVWNAALRRMAVRKGRELFKSQIAATSTQLRFEERTRLAADLHDYLAQNLTAIGYQVSAAARAGELKSEDLLGHIRTAERMLQSCRTELRRCLWDLKSDALEEKDFAGAIRKALSPIAGDTAIRIDCDIRRSRLNDTTAHAILSIVRELTANAVRHGRASSVAISGRLADGQLRFTVLDDGIGFDPSACAGPSEGHFGLDGIRDRLRRLNGDFTIESSPLDGTCAVITLHLAQA